MVPATFTFMLALTAIVTLLLAVGSANVRLTDTRTGS